METGTHSSSGREEMALLLLRGRDEIYFSHRRLALLCVRVLLYSFLNCKFISYITIYVL